MVELKRSTFANEVILELEASAADRALLLHLTGSKVRSRASTKEARAMGSESGTTTAALNPFIHVVTKNVYIPSLRSSLRILLANHSSKTGLDDSMLSRYHTTGSWGFQQAEICACSRGLRRPRMVSYVHIKWTGWLWPASGLAASSSVVGTRGP